MRNQSAMRNWYNCWYIYVTKEPQSHHTRSVSFSIEFIRFALHSHFPRTCRRRSHCRHWRRLFIAQRGRQPNSTHLISSPFYRPKNPISIFHNLHPIALGRMRVFNTKHPREGCDASRRHRCRHRVRLGPIRRMMYRCFPYLALDSRWESCSGNCARFESPPPLLRSREHMETHGGLHDGAMLHRMPKVRVLGISSWPITSSPKLSPPYNGAIMEPPRYTWGYD